MIQLTRIAPGDPFKRLRSQINAAMNEVEGDQPQLGMPKAMSVEYFKHKGDGPNMTRVATSAADTIKGSLFLHCLPDNTHTMVTDVSGCLWATADPVLEAGISKLEFSLIQISISSIQLSNRVTDKFKMPYDYTYPRPDGAFAYVGAGVTTLPIYPLGGKTIFMGFGTERPIYIDGPVFMWGTQNGVRILIESEYPLPN